MCASCPGFAHARLRFLVLAILALLVLPVAAVADDGNGTADVSPRASIGSDRFDPNAA